MERILEEEDKHSESSSSSFDKDAFKETEECYETIFLNRVKDSSNNNKNISLDYTKDKSYCEFCFDTCLKMYNCENFTIQEMISSKPILEWGFKLQIQFSTYCSLNCLFKAIYNKLKTAKNKICNLEVINSFTKEQFLKIYNASDDAQSNYKSSPSSISSRSSISSSSSSSSSSNNRNTEKESLLDDTKIDLYTIFWLDMDLEFFHFNSSKYLKFKNKSSIELMYTELLYYFSLYCDVENNDKVRLKKLYNY